MNCFFLFDANDRVLKLSEELRERLGYSESDVEGLVFDSLVVEDSTRFKPKADAVIRQKGYLKRKSGEIVEGSMRVERVSAGTDIFLLEIASCDEVGPERGERQGADQDSLHFLTTVSHELRVALNGVIGFANLLGVSSLDEEQKAILEKLQSCNYLLKGLVNDILEYSKVVSSKVDLVSERVRLESFVNDVAGLFRERARRKELELRVSIDPAAMRWVALPKMRVTQVLSNLISNAIKFTEEGWVAIYASVEGEWICIAVQDTGPGIDPTDAKSVFQPFFQARTDGDKSEGSGLGLAISRGLVEKMGGTLSLVESEGSGSRFEIRLPARTEEMEAEISLSNAQQKNKKEGKSKPKKPADREVKHVLVVEDNQLNADILSHFLQSYGATYDMVDNGRAAVDTYQDGKYDLILMDVMLPEMNGYEATEKILRDSKRKTPVPIIGVTAKVFRKDQMRCIEAGMAEVVHKPVDFKLLREVLDFHLYGGSRGDEGERETVEEGRSGNYQLGSSTEPSREVVEGILNLSTLEEYIGRMITPTNSRGEVIKTALSIVDAEVEKLVETLDAGNRKETGLRSHSLKGALALLGARGILDLAKGLEMVASDEEATLRAEHWKKLILSSYEEFRSALLDHADYSESIS